MELLERESCLADLDTALAEVRRGSGGLALVSGEAGIGKTSLVQRFTRRLGSDIRVIWGASDSLFSPRPLGPLHDMASQTGGELTVILDADTSHGNLFAAVLHEFNRRPTVAVFEDMHWADEATLDLLRFLGRRVSGISLLLVLTYRDDELGPRHALRTLIGDLGALPGSHRISLQPLSPSAVRKLVGEKDLDAVALYHQTGGNPFFITEVLASSNTRIPTSIRDAVLARAARLSPSGYAVLEAAAVIGQRVDPLLLSAVTGAEVRAAEESLTTGMLVAQGDELVFRHELARQTILDTVSPVRRHVLNGLVLDALKSSPNRRKDLARLAHHAEAAGDGGAVLEFAPVAARQASATGAHRAAAALFGLALQYADDRPATEQAGLLEAHALESLFIEDALTAIADRRQAIELWRQVGNPMKEGENLAYLAMALNGIDRWDEAAEAGQASIQILETLPPGQALVAAYRTQALFHINNHNNDLALDFAEKAAAVAEKLGDARMMAMAYDTLGSILMDLDYERGRETMERALGIAIEAGLDARVATIYANLGSVSCDLHRFQEASHLLAEGLAFTAERDLDMLRLYMLAWQALTLLSLGRWKEAEESAAEVLKWANLSAQSRVPALVVMGRLECRRGAISSIGYLDEALDIANRSGQFEYLAQVITARSEAAFLAGNRERTLDESLALYKLAITKGHPWYAAELSYWRWKAGEVLDIYDWMAKPYALQITSDWRAASEEWERLGCPYEQARALTEGEVSAQIQALEIFERLGAQPAADTLRAELPGPVSSSLPPRPRTATRENPFGLTNRQLEILALLTEDLTNAQIAARLHISPKTVDHHVSAVLTKLNVPNRQDAADLARKNPLVNPQK